LLPYDAKVSTIHSLCSSIGATIESLKEKVAKKKRIERNDVKDYQIPRFKMKKLSSHDLSKSIQIDKNAGNCSVSWSFENDIGFKFWTRTNPERIQPYSRREYRKISAVFQMCNSNKSKIPSGSDIGCEFEACVKYESPGRYYLLLPYDKRAIINARKEKRKEKANETQTTMVVAHNLPPVKTVVSLDPGVRTFQSTYDDSGLCIKYGQGCAKRLFQYAARQDNIRKKISKLQPAPILSGGSPAVDSIVSDSINNNVDKADRVRARKRTRARRHLRRVGKKIQHLKDDMHWRVAKDLLEQYQHILIPTFNVKGMVRKSSTGRKISRRTCRDLLHLSHYQFRQRLICKSEEYEDRRVHEVCEKYTTMACGWCGTLNRNVGSLEIYKCCNPHCQYISDRDDHGSRNIHLKNVEHFVGSYCFV
jgi:transposase